MAEPLLLGVDEGTTGVKAALFDRELKQVGEARRDKVNRHPQAGWVEQDGEEVLAAVVDAVAELLADAPGEVVACGLDHQGESVLAWDAETRRAADADRRLAGQALAGGARPARRPRGGGPEAQRPAVRPLLLGGQARLAARARRGGRRALGTPARCGWARSTRSSATASAPASPPTLDGVADPAPADRRPGLRSRLCEIFGVPIEVLPEIRDTAGDLGTSRTTSWPVELPLRGQTVDQQAALAGAGLRRPGRVKATYGTGVFVLAHVGEEVPEPAGGLLPTVAWRIDGKVEYALDGGVFAAGAMLEWLCRELGVAADPPALGELAREADDSGGARVLPGLAGIGAPWWRPNARAVLAGIYGGDHRRTSRARRSRASPGASPTSSRRSARRSPSTSCGSTAGSPTSR